MKTLPTPGESTGILEYKKPSGAGNVECDPPPGSVLKKRKTLVTCHVSNGDGVDKSCSFQVILIGDREPPETQGLFYNRTALN